MALITFGLIVSVLAMYATVDGRYAESKFSQNYAKLPHRPGAYRSYLPTSLDPKEVEPKEDARSESEDDIVIRQILNDIKNDKSPTIPKLRDERQDSDESPRQLDPDEDLRQLDPDEDLRQLDPDEDLRQMDPDEDLRQLDPDEDLRQLDPDEDLRQLDPDEDLRQMDPDEDLRDERGVDEPEKEPEKRDEKVVLVNRQMTSGRVQNEFQKPVIYKKKKRAVKLGSRKHKLTRKLHKRSRVKRA